MLTGLSHLTLAVADLDRSVAFYTGPLGARLRATWDEGAYLELGDVWLCLSVDPSRAPSRDYTHVAFAIDAASFEAFCARLRAQGVRQWKENRSEGASMYVVDPDGHRLEIHVGDLEIRLAACRRAPYRGMRFFA